MSVQAVMFAVVRGLTLLQGAETLHDIVEVGVAEGGRVSFSERRELSQTLLALGAQLCVTVDGAEESCATLGFGELHEVQVDDASTFAARLGARDRGDGGGQGHDEGASM